MLSLFVLFFCPAGRMLRNFLRRATRIMVLGMGSPASQFGKTRPLTIDRNLRDTPQYSLCPGPGFWELAFEGRLATFKHEPGAQYVAWLLLHPPRKPIHALVLALDARTVSGRTPGATEAIQQRWPGLGKAEVA
jgi:hypothetical protein